MGRTDRDHDWELGPLWVMCLLYVQVAGKRHFCTDFLASVPTQPVVKFVLFTEEHRPCGNPFHIATGSPGLSWNPEKPTVVIVPGRRPPRVQPGWVRHMAMALLVATQSNVLAADWLLPQHHEMTDGAYKVGKRLANVLRMLVAKGSSLDKFHLVGFGVGAHVAGIAGASLNGTVGRITGLDPFAPNFTETDSSVTLDYADGQFVDIIHTNFKPNEPVAALGSSQPGGHVDFYVGNGYQLPGCPEGLIEREKYVLCSHQRAKQLFTSSILTTCSMTAFPCRSIADFHRGLCTYCNSTGLHACPQLGYNISWLTQERPIPFKHLNAVLEITSAAPFCVTPFLLELHVGGDTPLEAQLLVQLTGVSARTSTILLPGQSMMQFEPTKVYQFLVSADHDDEYTTLLMDFHTERLLYLDWRKRRVKINHLLLTQLPRDLGTAYQAWNITATEGHTETVKLIPISIRKNMEEL